MMFSICKISIRAKPASVKCGL